MLPAESVGLPIYPMPAHRLRAKPGHRPSETVSHTTNFPSLNAR